jgi:hypothetical protein
LSSPIAFGPAIDKSSANISDQDTAAKAEILCKLILLVFVLLSSRATCKSEFSSEFPAKVVHRSDIGLLQIKRRFLMGLLSVGEGGGLFHWPG